MDDKIEAWVQRAMDLAADYEGERAYRNHNRQLLEAHLRTTPEGYRLVKEHENEALRKDAERFRSLHWHYEQDRDMGPGGRWWTSVSTNDPKIRGDKIAVIDAALKEQSNVPR